MAVWVIGDLHLSQSADKKMDIFPGWENYVERLRRHWSESVEASDTVVLAGDTSWGMSLEEALADLRLVDALPGRKLLLKGNHDYWWSTRSRMERFFEENGLNTLALLHNNAFLVEGMALCGSRGWLFERGAEHDRKIVLREAGRLERSLQQAQPLGGELVAFLHYPPVYLSCVTPEILDVMNRYGVRRCYYGHIHSAGCAAALCGEFMGIQFQLVSADFLRFRPLRIG